MGGISLAFRLLNIDAANSRLPPPGKYEFATVVKAFDAECPEAFDKITVRFAIEPGEGGSGQSSEDANAGKNEDVASPDLAEKTAPNKPNNFS